MIKTATESLVGTLPGIYDSDVAVIIADPVSVEAWADAIINGLALAHNIRREELIAYLSAFSCELGWEST